MAVYVLPGLRNHGSVHILLFPVPLTHRVQEELLEILRGFRSIADFLRINQRADGFLDLIRCKALLGEKRSRRQVSIHHDIVTEELRIQVL